MKKLSVTFLVLLSVSVFSKQSRAGGAINTMPVDTVTSTVSPDGTYTLNKGKDFIVTIEKDNTVVIINGTNALKIRDSGTVVENSGFNFVPGNFRDITANIESGSTVTSGSNVEVEGDTGSGTSGTSGTMPVVERKTVTAVTSGTSGTSGTTVTTTSTKTNGYQQWFPVFKQGSVQH